MRELWFTARPGSNWKVGFNTEGAESAERRRTPLVGPASMAAWETGEKGQQGCRTPKWFARLGGESGLEAAVGDGQILGIDARLAGGGHEVGIAEPARQLVQM